MKTTPMTVSVQILKDAHSTWPDPEMLTVIIHYKNVHEKSIALFMVEIGNTTRMMNYGGYLKWNSRVYAEI